MDLLINFANVVYLVAYFMRDIRWLRAFTIVAASLLASYFYCRPEPLMAAVYWNVFFGALNAYHLARPNGKPAERPNKWCITVPSLRTWARLIRCRACA